MNSGKKLIQLGIVGARKISMSQACRQSNQQIADYSKLKKAQEHFQMNNGLLIHEKGGVVDKLLFYTTMSLCVVGLGLSGRVLYQLSNPASNN